ncbi:MAG: ADP-forming succinate--CoA ligase subunit beta [Chromatiales bacterium]|nr:ADP-forming succinate--CoA ligase subunit beta [Chromatiales bacterium]
MKLHEYQAKRLFSDYGVSVPDGVVVDSTDAAVAAAGTLGGSRWVVKAQVHAGGRGKAGGIRLVDSIDELRKACDELLGGTLATHQTHGAGLPIHRLLIERPTAIARELYLSALVDRASERIVFVASRDGGMDIEAVAAEHPERILSVGIPVAAGMLPYQARRLAFALGLEKPAAAALGKLLAGLFRMFNECDARLVEINPLVVTADGQLVALDAKVDIDDNALFRQSKLAELRDRTQEDATETAAEAHGLNYVTLDGDIACMVNGAGLAMATMDLIKLHGGEPANFLDVGGGTTAERVAEAFKLILGESRVRAILVNIFGGIVRCDLIAEGIITAVREVGVGVPVVVRLEGTNAEAGRALLADSGLDLIAGADLADAANKVVGAARGVAA